MKNLITFTEKISPRLDYVLGYISNIWDVEMKMTNNWEEFIHSDLPKINYSPRDFENCVQILPHKLLFENDVHDFEFATIEDDIFALVFFFLSRYEEYVITERDRHNRFQAKSAYLNRTDKLEIPHMDVQLNAFAKKVQETYPALALHQPEFKNEITIDIDQAFLYKNKSFKRFVGASVKDFSKMKMKRIVDRKMSYFGVKHDPWDVYDDLKRAFIKAHIKPRFFFLVGAYDAYDKNLNAENRSIQKLIKEIDAWANVGLHPSYASNQNTAKLEKEKERLEKILDKKVTNSRQHYIKFTLPETYRTLIDTGITDDYTMGFADRVGFRAGTCRPFLWYDIEKEEVTQLKIHPFCAMDVTLKNYLKDEPDHGLFRLNALKTAVKQVGGTFSVIYHNESLSGHGEWEEWNTMFMDFILE